MAWYACKYVSRQQSCYKHHRDARHIIDMSHRPRCKWWRSPSTTSSASARSAAPKRRSRAETSTRWCCRTSECWAPWQSSRGLMSGTAALHRMLLIDALLVACFCESSSQRYDALWSARPHCLTHRSCNTTQSALSLNTPYHGFKSKSINRLFRHTQMDFFMDN